MTRFFLMAGLVFSVATAFAGDQEKDTGTNCTLYSTSNLYKKLEEKSVDNAIYLFVDGLPVVNVGNDLTCFDDPLNFSCLLKDAPEELKVNVKGEKLTLKKYVVGDVLLQTDDRDGDDETFDPANVSVRRTQLVTAGGEVIHFAGACSARL